MTDIDLPTNKNWLDRRLPSLYRKAISVIEDHAQRHGAIKNGLIPYPEIQQTLSRMFHLRKDEAIELYDELREAGILEVVPYHGIRIVK